MRGKLTLVMIMMFVGAVSSLAQSPVQEVGDEKEPELRAELVGLVKEDQGTRGMFDKFRRAHGLFVDNKTLNERLDKEPEVKKQLQALGVRMQLIDEVNLLRMKEIVTKYGWPGKSLVGTEAAGAAWLLVQHGGDQDVAFQRLALEAMKKLPACEVENTHLASLTDRVLLNEGKKQLYGMMLTRNEKRELVPKPIEDEANVDKRRAELGLQPLAEYLRRSK